MHLEFLLEEPSAEAALRLLLPKLLSDRATFAFHPHQGKTDLLKKLPGRLRGYRAWLPDDWYVVVLVDNDQEDCQQLKGELERMARQAGLRTKSAVLPIARFQVLNRLAVEELEAWFLGDFDAIHLAYPRVKPSRATSPKYRHPDEIRGGTWEALAQLLRSYYPTGLPKIQVARAIARHMDPARNRSHSFQVFVRGLDAILDAAAGA